MGAVIVNITSPEGAVCSILIGLLHNCFIELYDSSDLCLN